MLTETKIRNLKTRRRRYRANDSDGLGIQVTHTGRKTWVYRYTVLGRRESMTMGRWPAVTLAAARKLRVKAEMQISRGFSPLEERRRDERKARQHVTVREFGRRWLDEVVVKARKNSIPVERMLDREVYPRLGARPVRRVTSEEVQALIFRKRDAGRPEAAAALRHMLKRMFDYGRVCGVVDSNPTDATPLKFVTRHKSRTRALSQAELKTFYQRLADRRLPRRMAIALELILLTLCRKSELLLARWDHIDLKKGIWEVPADLSKSGKPHMVYLSQRALDLLRIIGNYSMPEGYGSGVDGCNIDARAFLFPAQSSPTQPLSANTLNKAINRVKWGIPHFTPHDLRRTAITHLNELGYNSDWIEKAANHVLPGIRGVYNKAQYAEQRKAMLQEWADWLEKLK